MVPLTRPCSLGYEAPMQTMKDSKILSEVALGNEPPDLAIVHGTLFNAHTGEFIPGQSIWIKGKRIAYVGPDHEFNRKGDVKVIDVAGMVLLPGLIDGHTHLSTSLSGIDEFIRYVIPGGLTTIVAETIELATIVGKDGIDYFVKGFENQPIRFYYTTPPLCGLTPVEERTVPSNDKLLPLLKDPRCVGLGEIYWGNLLLKGKQGRRVRELSRLALGLGKRVEGHTAGASGKKLQAYTSFGPSSCHEPIAPGEVLERLRLGYWVMVRQGSIRKELPGIQEIFQKPIDFRRLILSTDGVDPKGLIEEGYLDAALRTALQLGVPPSLAYQLVTINVAEHFRLDHLIGSLSPGKMADIVVIPSRREFKPQLVLVGGKTVFKDGRLTIRPRKVSCPKYMLRTVKVEGYSLPSPPQEGKVRVMESVTDLVTRERIVDLDDAETSQDIIMAFALDRLHSTQAFMGFLMGFGLRQGAFGSTMSWDSPDLIVLGCDPVSVKTAIARLKETGGGLVHAIGDEIVSELPARICGVMSLHSVERVRREMGQIEETLRNAGVKVDRPILTISTLSAAAIPHLRITHHGYVRLKDRKILSWKVQ